MADPAAYPPVSFSFSLSFSGSSEPSDAAFQEASGINVDMNTEEMGSEGENRFKYRLPGKTKYSNLVLKRGVIPKNSPLFTWCDQTLNQGLAEPIQTKTITVALLDDKQNILISWVFQDAYPVKWSVSEFKSMENAYAVESIEFAYNYFETKKNS
ncbi:phage tail protein [Flavilitoribacter nigricans]|uniref:Phage tail protein n=1 Tax=Flavilitoribacter nigricans (strain ATCC 23147 / DSM 23189 / NBRC 102662 / NCIMB 1420 / SS-2) TaxID=1122177 RepID=A0A2D0NCG7_FLAN2|nr:phage tail protein [Flavilitoribacter nigricans]PHN06066.1 phage tail protein [Flavilitoribacter nigricans DSM 23189 = NBRC 102662]